MPTFVWILIWAVAIGVVAVLAVREVRSNRRSGPGDFELSKARTHGPANRAAAAGPPPQISQNGTGI